MDSTTVKLTVQIRKRVCLALYVSDFIWSFGKQPFPEHLGKYIIKIGKIRAKIPAIGKI